MSVLALYDGRCAICDEHIVADSDYIVSVDDEWCHEDCAEAEQ